MELVLGRIRWTFAAALAVVLLLVMTLPLVAGAQTTTQELDLSTQTGNVTIDAGGTWTLTGTLAGSVTVSTGAEDVVLVLDGVDITSSNGPAIIVLSTGEVTIETAAGSTNTIADGGDADEMDGAIWAETNLTFAGEGVLEITAVSEGVETSANITINSGTLKVNAGEDGLNANTDGVSQITINDGTVFVVANEGDGIDSNGGLEINGGTVVAYGSIIDSNSGIDADLAVVINGGTVVASGSPMARVDASSTQGVVYASFDGNLAANTPVALMLNGEAVIGVIPPIDQQSLIISTADIDATAAYELSVGGDFQTNDVTLLEGEIVTAGQVSGTVSAQPMMGRP